MENTTDSRRSKQVTGTSYGRPGVRAHQAEVGNAAGIFVQHHQTRAVQSLSLMDKHVAPLVVLVVSNKQTTWQYKTTRSIKETVCRHHHILNTMQRCRAKSAIRRVQAVGILISFPFEVQTKEGKGSNSVISNITITCRNELCFPLGGGGGGRGGMKPLFASQI